MFIKLTRNGSRTYLQIAESYRDPQTGKPRQRHIANLGRLDRLVDGGDLNALIEGLLQATGQAKLGTWTQALEEDKTDFEPARLFGSAWAVWSVWKKLGLDELLNRSDPPSAQRGTFEQLVRVMVTNRLCAGPYGGRFAEWLERVYLPGLDTSEVTQSQLAGALDTLLPLKRVMERHLIGTHTQRDTIDTVFYLIAPLRIHDWTDSPGASAEQDQLHVVGVALTPAGFPLQHEITEGVINLPLALREIAIKLRSRFPVRRLVIVADLDLLSLDTLEAMKDLKLPGNQPVEYIVAIPPARYEELTASIDTPQWEATSRAQSGEVVESVTLSAGRRLMMARNPTRIRRARRQRVQRLSPVIKLAGMLERQLEAQDASSSARGPQLTDTAAKLLLSKAVAGAHASRLIHIDQDELSFAWWWDIKALKREMALDGTLILVSNVSDMAAPDIVSQYKNLAEIEHCFSISRHQLEIASLDRRRGARLQEHTLINYLVFAIRHLLRARLAGQGIDLAPDQLLERLDAIQCHTVRLPNNRQFKTLNKLPSNLEVLLQAIEVEQPTRERILRR
jgi:hypothetical protein